MEANLWFKCDRCDNVDHMKSTPPAQDGTGQLVCHRCQFGTWHHHFAEETYDSSYHDVVNAPSNARREGFLGHPVFPEYD